MIPKKVVKGNKNAFNLEKVDTNLLKFWVKKKKKVRAGLKKSIGGKE